MRDFLGYLRKHHRMMPDFALFMRGDLISQYLAFKRARGNQASTQVAILRPLKKFVKYHVATSAEVRWSTALSQLLADLGNLINQASAS